MDSQPSEITSEQDYLNRRSFIKRSGLTLAGLYTVPSFVLTNSFACDNVSGVLKEQIGSDEKLNSYKEITTYNNYYEFSTNKEAVYQLAKEFNPRPWTLTIEGEVEQAKTFDIEELVTLFSIEERIYRMRCVEGWSMVIPWNGFSLCQLLKRVQPTSRAKYVEFISVHRPSEMIGQRRDSLQWPYREVLRMDEAMHPLTLIATGLYGKVLPNQNGAPLRLIVPWKYGYKSIKAVTTIRMVEKPPESTWSLASKGEYGFYANVNPDVPHPRWSQHRENRIGEFRKRKTLMFNGYAEQVAHLYEGMDLKTYF